VRTLVTGAAGFIGSRVAALALAEGHRVVGLDNLSDAYDVRLKQWRLRQLESQPGFDFRYLDITDRTSIDILFSDAGPFDGVVHLAARAGVRQSVENPWLYLDVNATGTLTLLEACRQHDVGKFVLSSTSSLYGACNPLPYREDAGTDRPLSPYAASKKAAEAMAHTYHHLHALDVTVLRYFTVYGPAGRPDMSLFRFVQWVDEGRPVTLFGDGRQSRDFTYVDNVVDANIAAATAPTLSGESVNIAAGSPQTVLEVLDAISKEFGYSVQPVHAPARPGDIRDSHADLSVARSLLGYKVSVDFQTGLRRTVEYLREASTVGS
jgi:nucleoside-diphosphate-sugar epimerase